MKHIQSHSFVVILASALGLTLVASMSGETQFVAHAGLKPAECYEVPSRGNPFGGSEKTTPETWCYREMEKPQGSKLIYNLDENGNMRTELSVLVEADGTMRHVSLKQGKITPHRVHGFNPVGAPLTPPEGSKRISEPISPSASKSIDDGIRTLDNDNFENIPVRAAVVQEGEFSATADIVPWRGYWYPYSSSRIDRGSQSPMAKFDRFVARRTAQTNPGSQAWELRNHSGGVAWSGHCNGWAAASTLAPEPTKSLHDPYSGETFTPFDLKGLLIERHYCPKYVLYGTRNFETGQDPSDIYPSTFHNVLTYFLGELHKPVLADIMANKPIQNSVFSAYTMKVRRTGSHTFFVDMTAKVHLYDEGPSNEVGPARFVMKRYAYSLTVDDDGQAVGGSWSTPNPDFLWIALAPSTCPDHNEIVDQFWIDEIGRVGQPIDPEPMPSPAPSSGGNSGGNAPRPAPSATPAPSSSATPAPTPAATPAPAPTAAPQP